MRIHGVLGERRPSALPAGGPRAQPKLKAGEFAAIERRANSAGCRKRRIGAGALAEARSRWGRFAALEVAFGDLTVNWGKRSGARRIRREGSRQAMVFSDALEPGRRRSAATRASRERGLFLTTAARSRKRRC
ncbi:hypothetical protein ERJ75_000447900 [Trypanosoma vivax]|nr:hypothetical protein ERJ75_000447900 [Trypanosoma vivax]